MFQTNHVCCLTILFASCVTSLIGVQAQDSETAETKIKIGRYTQTAKGVPNLEDSIIASRQKDFEAAMQAMMKLEAASKTADDLFAQDASKTGLMKKDEPDKNLKFDMNQFKERRDSFTDHYVPLLTVARFVKWESKTKNPQTRKFYHSWGRLKKISPDGTKIQIIDPSGEFVVVELSKLDSKANKLIDEIRILLANHDTVHKTLLPEVNEFLADWTVYADAVRVAMQKQKEEELKRQAVLAALEAQERPDVEAELEDVANFPSKYEKKKVVFKQIEVSGDVERDNSGVFTLDLRSKRNKNFFGQYDPRIETQETIAQQIINATAANKYFTNCSVYALVNVVNKKTQLAVYKIEVFNVGGKIAKIIRLDERNVTIPMTTETDGYVSARPEDVTNFPTQFNARKVVFKGVKVDGDIERDNKKNFILSIKSARQKNFFGKYGLYITIPDVIAQNIIDQTAANKQFVNCNVYGTVGELDGEPWLQVNQLKIFNVGGKVSAVFRSDEVLAEKPLMANSDGFIEAELEDVSNFPDKYRDKKLLFNGVEVVGDVERDRNGRFTLGLKSKRKKSFFGSYDPYITISDSIAQRILDSTKADKYFINCSVYAKVASVDNKVWLQVGKIEVYNVGGKIAATFNADDKATGGPVMAGAGGYVTAEIEDVANFPKKYLDKKVAFQNVGVDGDIEKDRSGRFTIDLKSTRNKNFFGSSSPYITVPDSIAQSILESTEANKYFVNCTVYAAVKSLKEKTWLQIDKIEIYNVGGKVSRTLRAGDRNQDKPLMVRKDGVVVAEIEDVVNAAARYEGKRVVFDRVEVNGDVERDTKKRFTLSLKSKRKKNFFGQYDPYITIPDNIGQQVIDSTKADRSFINCSVYATVSRIDGKLWLKVDQIEVYNVGGKVGVTLK